jgi:putative Holliday junction resolvase
MMPRILAFDFGKKRIGLAISDPMGVVVRGLETFERKRVRDDIQSLAEIARREQAELLLFGDPLHLDGSRGRASGNVREFAQRLQKVSGIPVAFFDERLTTVEADEALREQGVRFEERRKRIDQMAAIVLLQSYLEATAA